eukprot:1237727-Pyramimonas_sp.AAC.1
MRAEAAKGNAVDWKARGPPFAHAFMAACSYIADKEEEMTDPAPTARAGQDVEGDEGAPHRQVRKDKRRGDGRPHHAFPSAHAEVRGAGAEGHSSDH